MAKDLTFAGGEGQTPLEDLSGLLAPVKTRQALNELEAKNNGKAYAKYLLFVKTPKAFNLLAAGVLCEIHQEMFAEVWSWAGEFRKGGGKNIGVPAVKIGSELHRLLSDWRHWEERKVPAVEIAARIHHRLVEIHPFENGNGRWARLVTNIYLHGKGFPLIEWPQDPKVICEDFKPKYLTALKKADQGEYAPLFELHKKYTGAG